MASRVGHQLGEASALVSPTRYKMTPQERREILRKASLDCWIAISEAELRIVAEGKELSDVLAEAARQGFSDPLVIKTPKQWVASCFKDGASFR
jgi:hypothetical protein